jgi:alkylation response protein AidB-like acyl-CoA dehydrogenase
MLLRSFSTFLDKLASVLVLHHGDVLDQRLVGEVDSDVGPQITSLLAVVDFAHLELIMMDVGGARHVGSAAWAWIKIDFKVLVN